MNPDGVFKPDSFFQVGVAEGTSIVCVSGQVAIDADGDLVGSGDLAAQSAQVYRNLFNALKRVGGSFADVVKLTVFVPDYSPEKMEQLAAGAMTAAQELGFDPRKAITLVGVAALSDPADEIEAVRKRMGWTMPWCSALDDFVADFGVVDGFGFNVFYRSGGDIYRTYFTTGRAAEALGTIWTLLDLTPLGRQETWEDSPKGTPQTPPYGWWRLHDEYRS